MTDRMDYEQELGELILLALDGKITKDQYDYLQDQIITNPAAQDYYLEFMTTYAGFSSYESSAISFVRPDKAAEGYNGLFSELAQDEKVAPTVQIEADDQKDDIELIKKVQRDHITRQFNRKSAWSMFAAAAAILMVVLFIQFAPVRSGKEVVTLSDSINAKWADSSIALNPGVRLMDSDPPFMLRQGYAQLQFDNGAEVVVEAPAEFQLMGTNQIQLNYGQLYATVPDQAHGFTVHTANSKVIDLGTEFGIKESLDGQTDIHVVKGSVNLNAELSGKQFDMVVTGGLARQISASLGKISKINFDEHLFTRKIHSGSGLVWKGQRSIDLADIVGGGNGRGTGKNEVGIDPLSGMRYEYYSKDRQGNGQYMPVLQDPYVDGVFVPQGQNPQQVSTAGHIFEECPVTNNIFYAGIITGSGKNLDDYRMRPARASLAGRLYGTLEYPSIFMHANLGITFDLDAIRSGLPGFGLDRFVSDAGLSSDAPRQGNVDVWVLVDGQVRFSNIGIRDKGKAISLDVPLKASDRFLSLVVTDGGDEDYPNRDASRSTDSDWCVFGYPRLELSH